MYKKRNYKPSPESQARRELLIQNSALAKSIRKGMEENAKTLDEALAAASTSINFILINSIYKAGSLELKTKTAWKEEGYKLVKGAYDGAFLIWGQPRKCKEAKKEEAKEGEEANEYKLFPVCYLFGPEQVETWEAFQKNKKEGTSVKVEIKKHDIVEVFKTPEKTNTVPALQIKEAPLVDMGLLTAFQNF